MYRVGLGTDIALLIFQSWFAISEVVFKTGFAVFSPDQYSAVIYLHGVIGIMRNHML